MNEVVVPIRALEHYEYCPRQAAIVHVDGFWVDNIHTLRGVRGHKRVDEAPSRVERGRLVLRGIPLWSESLGLSGRADAVEVYRDGSVVPVEYKSGRRHGLAAEVQVCAQALCLEEMLGQSVPIAHVWYAGPRRRYQVELTGDLRSHTFQVIATLRAAVETEVLPPAVDDERCRECQLRGYCLPDLCAHPGRVAAYVAGLMSCT